MKIILGNPAYPKSEALILPANGAGVMNKGVQSKIIKDGWKMIADEAKKVTNENKYEIGDCFTTGPGRLKRRGTKKIYHAVIRNLPNDFLTIDSIRKALSNTLKKTIKDKMSSVTVCGLGINQGELDKTTAARIIVETCDRYRDKIEIKIMDEDVEFINEAKRFWD